ncbi:MAG: exopolysaccharide biosynthesis protein [Thermodesulfobacteriota bacterium]
MDQEINKIEHIIDLIESTVGDKEKISLDLILSTLGRRSFGPILLLAGLVTLAPIIGDIPGMPTIMGLVVMLTAVQLLIRREHFWMPHWMLRRSVRKNRLCKGLQWIRPVARFLDRFIRPRLTMLIRNGGLYVIAFVCICVAAVMPLMEFIPFSANAAGIILTIFGLSLTATDGLLALIALGLISLAAVIIGYRLITGETIFAVFIF